MKIIANGLQIEVDIQGPEHGEPILLIMGLVSGAVVISSGRLPTRKGSSSGPGGSA